MAAVEALNYPMSLVPYGLARPFLFGLDPEQAHEITLDGLARTQNTPLRLLLSQHAASMMR